MKNWDLASQHDRVCTICCMGYYTININYHQWLKCELCKPLMTLIIVYIYILCIIVMIFVWLLWLQVSVTFASVIATIIRCLYYLIIFDWQACIIARCCHNAGLSHTSRQRIDSSRPVKKVCCQGFASMHCQKLSSNINSFLFEAVFMNHFDKHSSKKLYLVVWLCLWLSWQPPGCPGYIPVILVSNCWLVSIIIIYYYSV